MVESYERWLSQIMEDESLAAELAAIAGDEGEKADRFGREVEFGTGGLRGVLGAGPNRMNLYTVRKATQGMANYLNQNKGENRPGVAISYDSRRKSDLFAREAARVLAANGIVAHLYRELMPTPALSYAVRELQCQAGIMITASHNPAKYNGFKAYGPDGCQMVSQVADAVWAQIAAIDCFSDVRVAEYERALSEGLIRLIPESLVQQYLTRVLEEQVRPGICKGAGLRVVYTPLNGTGGRCVRTVLDRMGVEEVTVVPEQEHPNGDFPTCPYPNPEVREAMALGMELAAKVKAHLLLATDPDCDRVGIAVEHKGTYRMLTGNEVGVLLVDYIASQKKALGTLPKNPIVVKSIVTTTMVLPVAAAYGVEVVDVLTGFKYIGEQIAQLEERGESERFLLGFEESYGYLSGGYVRDKDAVDGSLLIAEMTAYHLKEGRTLVDVLEGLYEKYGTYQNGIDNFAFEGLGGMEKMVGLMENLRQNPPDTLGGSTVVAVTDYQASTTRRGDGVSPVTLPKSNVLSYELESGATVVIRPSGTEPKLKAYYSIKGENVEKCEKLQAQLSGDVRKVLGL